MDYNVVAQALLPELKLDRQLTWADEDRDKRLVRFCIDGMVYIDSIMPAPVNFETNLNAKRLLFVYVMYAESQAVDEFVVNYQSQLLGMKMDAEREAYMAEVDADAQDLP